MRLDHLLNPGHPLLTGRQTVVAGVGPAVPEAVQHLAGGALDPAVHPSRGLRRASHLRCGEPLWSAQHGRRLDGIESVRHHPH